MSSLKKWIFPLASALAAVLIAYSGVLNRPDLAVSDLLYQSRAALDGRIVIVGIDERAIDELGPVNTWGRGIMAMALDYINSGEDGRPAVIGVDVLYTGVTEEGADAWLAESAGAFGNVVVAGAATFGSSVVVDGEGGFSVDDFSVLGYDGPYEELKRAAGQGHINAMFDKDGILRHSLHYIIMEDGTRMPSFAWAIAEKYVSANGIEPLREPPVDEKGFWYVPMAGKPGDFYEHISIADLLDGSVPQDYFNDKIVLIGPYAAGLMDSYVTSADHALAMYGVEFQANVINALLNQDFKQEAGAGVQLLFLAVFVFFCALWFRKRAVLPSTIVWAGVAGGWVILCRAMYANGIVLRVLWVPLMTTLLCVFSIAANYVRAAAQKRRITSTFKRYVAPEIVAELLREGADSLGLGGKLCDVAVLFVDIRGFTAMSEVLSPVQVVEILNRYLTLTASCIINNKGTLDKFVGDATMAFWGAPLPQEDYVMRAAKAALDMVQGSEALSQELMRQYGRTVSFGVGIHTGPAVVGNIGAELRMDYTAIGDTVNTAARLEANAPGGSIYISRAVADALEGRIDCESLGDSIRLKGKAAGFEVLTLKGLRDT